MLFFPGCASLSPGSSVHPSGQFSPLPELNNDWRKPELCTGLSAQQVQQLMGEPQKRTVLSPSEEIWEYEVGIDQQQRAGYTVYLTDQRVTNIEKRLVDLRALFHRSP